MSHPDGVQTNEGRLATFSASQPAKRRASATRKRAAATVTWPHQSPNAEDVSSPLTGTDSVDACSFPRQVSTSPRVARARTTAAASYVRCSSTAGKMATTPPWSTTRTRPAAAGPSTATSNTCSSPINPWTKIHCRPSMRMPGRRPSRAPGPMRISVGGSARFQRFVIGRSKRG